MNPTNQIKEAHMLFHCPLANLILGSASVAASSSVVAEQGGAHLELGHTIRASPIAPTR